MGNLHSELVSEGEWDALRENLSLSPRQADIVYRLLHAKSDNEIARELDISVPTVRTYMTRMFQKFAVKDRVELLVYVFTSLRSIGQSVTSPSED
ncbi:MAG: helix-turn-helix transcriptional regulator [Candidatus Eiseniibacteriota bacterium]|nr:MAG: helix-turn-helix transcriptional regulator [Candidatus Eisenbacteria bacterium]